MANINEQDLSSYRKKVINMIYKLLPLREENSEWEKYLESLLIEIEGWYGSIENEDSAMSVLRISFKLKGLKTLTGDDDFKAYRRTVFECINMIE